MKKLILVTVIIAAVIIFVYPNYKKSDTDTGNPITKNPVTALEKSFNAGTPVFLDFYSAT